MERFGSAPIILRCGFTPPPAPFLAAAITKSKEVRALSNPGPLSQRWRIAPDLFDGYPAQWETRHAHGKLCQTARPGRYRAIAASPRINGMAMEPKETVIVSDRVGRRFPGCQKIDVFTGSRSGSKWGSSFLRQGHTARKIRYAYLQLSQHLST